jgi:hypothetical protein
MVRVEPVQLDADLAVAAVTGRVGERADGLAGLDIPSLQLAEGLEGLGAQTQPYSVLLDLGRGVRS